MLNNSCSTCVCVSNKITINLPSNISLRFAVCCDTSESCWNALYHFQDFAFTITRDLNLFVDWGNVDCFWWSNDFQLANLNKNEMN